MEFRQVPIIRTEGRIGNEWFERVDILVAIDVLEDTSDRDPMGVEPYSLGKALVCLGVARDAGHGLVRVDPEFTRFALEVRGAYNEESAKLSSKPARPPFVVPARNAS